LRLGKFEETKNKHRYNKEWMATALWSCYWFYQSSFAYLIPYLYVREYIIPYCWFFFLYWGCALYKWQQKIGNKGIENVLIPIFYSIGTCLSNRLQYTCFWIKVFLGLRKIYNLISINHFKVSEVISCMHWSISYF
jgi:hypothetical protein